MSKKNKDEFVKSPLNYTGGKHKLLPKLVPLMPIDESMTVFVDLFGGGGNVVANAPSNYTTLVYNELDSNVHSLVSMFGTQDEDDIVSYVDSQIKRFNLNRENKDEYFAYRDFYNAQSIPDVRDLFVLIAHSFSNQIRFNRNGKFNLPFGKRTFNDSMRANLHGFMQSLQSRNFVAKNLSFSNFDFSLYAPDSTFIYCDPPYLGSIATYNEHDGWTEKDEANLLLLLDELNASGYKWMLSNNLEYDNPILSQWITDNADRYTLIDMKHDYKNCNYHKNIALTAKAENDISNPAEDAVKEIVVINYEKI